MFGYYSSNIYLNIKKIYIQKKIKNIYVCCEQNTNLLHVVVQQKAVTTDC